MFNNLIESSSHTKEYKRRGSFLLFTGACYVVLFVVMGVVSIYAYDARLEQQILEDVVLLSPQDVVTPEPVQAARPDRPAPTSDTSRVPVREVAMLSVNHPEVVPDSISATPSRNLPLPKHGAVRIGGPDSDPDVIGGPGSRTPGGIQVASQPPRVILPDDPPPAPTPAPQPPKILKVSRVLNSQALSLPPPTYPPIARQTRTQGTVIVQVLIDEEGKVISAKATSGHPFLVPEAQKAAFRARFSPTVLGDQKVKVQGVITYNFVLGN
jgi:periplasmic protein TonB